MGKTIRSLLAISILLIASVSPARAGGSAEPGGEQEEVLGVAAVAAVRMGVLIPLTGALSEFGQGFQKAGELATRQLIEAGVPVQVRYVDSETSAIPGVEAARTLVNVERVHVLIGAAASGVTLPVAETVAIPNGIPQISNASTTPLLTVLPADRERDLVFRTAPSDALQGVILGKLAYDEGYRRAAVFWVNNAYGQGLLEEFRRSFESRGGQVVAAVPHDERPAPTYVSELRQLMNARPDVMLALGYPGQATVYLKEFFEAGYNEEVDLLFCDGTKSVDIPTALGPANLAGFYGTAPGTAEGVSRDRFEADYEALHGQLPPLPYMSNIYDAMVVAGLAAVAARAQGREISPAAIRDNLRLVANTPGEVVTAGVDGLRRAVELLEAGQDINYEGAAGAVDFDENGDVTTPVEIWRYVEQEPYIETVRVETEIPR